MDLLFKPRTFKELIEADLRRAARLIVEVQDEVDPQLRIATPEGDYWLAVTLPTDDAGREAMLHRLKLFMAWKQAAAFTFASELNEPDCVFALGVSFTEVHACIAAVRRAPRPWDASSFGAVEWLDRQSVGNEMIGLLPRGAHTMTNQEISMLESWFGSAGRFPAVHIPSGEVRGI
ncbi:MAG: hypothetical protein ABL907_14740 [Hyphomicrobium sp.]